MKNILKYEDFINEEITMKQAAIGIGAGAAIVGGTYYTMQNNGKAKLTDVIEIGGEDFKEYSLITYYNVFKLKVDEGIIVSSHDYTEGSGDDEKTISVTNLIVPESVDKVWYYYSLLNGVCATSKEFGKSKLLEISKLKKYKDTPTYTVYTAGFLSPFDYIIVTKIHKGKSNEDSIECELMDIGHVYNCEKINDDIYVFSFVRAGSGSFGGAGAGVDF